MVFDETSDEQEDDDAVVAVVGCMDRTEIDLNPFMILASNICNIRERE